VAVLVFALAGVHVYTVGIDWSLPAYLVIGAACIFPAFMAQIPLFCTPKSKLTILVVIDDVGIWMEAGERNQEIPWSSFAGFGFARESDRCYYLKSGRGAVAIPKRAFDTKDQEAEFRAFVCAKMGERCQFRADGNNDNGVNS
jgi:hypothetical protein